MLPEVHLPERYNYIGCFLTLACNLRCGYCINHHGPTARARRHLRGEDWIRLVNRLVTREDLPVTLQGGEPSVHPDFIRIILGIREDVKVDLLTNLEFDVEEFARRVPPDRLRRDAPYASIRVSYHPPQHDLESLLGRVFYLRDRGYHIGVWGVLHPLYEGKVLEAQEQARRMGIDFRTKEFLGFHDGVLYGSYRYPGGVELRFRKRCTCRTTELLVGTDGLVYRCHSDFYALRDPVGDLLDPGFRIEDRFRPCDWFGHCNPCDLKVKTDRFQRFGHTSCEVLEIRDRDVDGPGRARLPAERPAAVSA